VDAVIHAAVALSAVAALAAVGALLATALLVVPAATTRLVTSRLPAWQAWSVALAAAEGVCGLWLAYVTDAPPGATIAVLGGAVFALVAWGRAAGPRTRTALAVAAVAGLGAAGFAAGPATGDGPRVVATTTQLGDVARTVAGDAAGVTQLLQPAADPHDYEPRPSDVRAVGEAGLVLASGVGLDDWVDDVAEDAGATSGVVRAGDGAPHLVRTDGGIDPHWWHDLRNVAAVARTVGARLASHVPAAERPGVRARAAAYARRAERLDAAVARCIAQIPRAQRRLVTDHDAFATFAARYGLEIVGTVIPSRSTQAQPSAGEVARLADVVRREGVRAIFPERSVDPRLARALAEQAGARVGPALYADALGPRDSRGATVLGAVAANADAIVEGLTGGVRGCR
jgi:zinc/manganese transport system substrate-binding protein